MVRHCVVKDCKSDSRYHPCTKFFKFPGAVRKKQLRQQWIINVNRKGKNHTLWEPKPEDVVCHKHFVEGNPTIKYPVPQLAMGHRFVKRVTGRQFTSRKVIKKTVKSSKEKSLPQEVDKPCLPNHQTEAEILKPAILPANIDNPSASGEDMQPLLISELFRSTVQGISGEADLRGPPDENDVSTLSEADTQETNILTPLADVESCLPAHHNPLSFHTYALPPADDPEFMSIPNVLSKCENENGAQSSDCEVQQLRRQLKHLKARLSTAHMRLSQQPHSSQFSYKSLVGDDEKTRQFTGFPTYKCFSTIFEKRIKPRAQLLSLNHHQRQLSWHEGPFSRKPGPERQLVLIDEFLLVMMRLRLGLLEADLGERFGIKAQQVSRIIGKWLPCLTRCLKKCVKMPSKEQVKMHMPKVFRTYPNTRVIIDCTEIFLERPTSLLARQQTWSTYKHHNTAKALVGISPDGGITFLSKTWGGRASDKHIVKNSGFLECLDPYDQVMADRGFDIAAELAERSCTLNIPPFTKGKSQLSRAEVERHRKVSSLRIHVERAIERLKNFRILQGVFPLNHVHMLDDILLVCAAVTNMWPPIISD